MVPNLSNIAKHHCLPNKLPTFLATFLHTEILPFFEIPIVSIDKTIRFG